MTSPCSRASCGRTDRTSSSPSARGRARRPWPDSSIDSAGSARTWCCSTCRCPTSAIGRPNCSAIRRPTTRSAGSSTSRAATPGTSTMCSSRFARTDGTSGTPAPCRRRLWSGSGIDWIGSIRTSSTSWSPSRSGSRCRDRRSPRRRGSRMRTCARSWPRPGRRGWSPPRAPCFRSSGSRSCRARRTTSCGRCGASWWMPSRRPASRWAPRHSSSPCTVSATRGSPKRCRDRPTRRCRPSPSRRGGSTPPPSRRAATSPPSPAGERRPHGRPATSGPPSASSTVCSPAPSTPTSPG